MSSTISLRRTRSLVLADLFPSTFITNVVVVVGAASFVGALAQVSLRLPFTPVPVTGQTLGVLLAGTALGWRRAAAAMTLYGVAGVLGVPWFANHTSGYVGVSFGYVVGFVLAAALCGHLAERGTDRSIAKSALTMIAGEAVIYGIGVSWLAVSLHVGGPEALMLGLIPFLAGDAVKVALATCLLPGAWKLAA